MFQNKSFKCALCRKTLYCHAIATKKQKPHPITLQEMPLRYAIDFTKKHSKVRVKNKSKQFLICIVCLNKLSSAKTKYPNIAHCGHQSDATHSPFPFHLCKSCDDILCKSCPTICEDCLLLVQQFY
jgi:hypothetical protein